MNFRARTRPDGLIEYQGTLGNITIVLHQDQGDVHWLAFLAWGVGDVAEIPWIWTVHLPYVWLTAEEARNDVEGLLLQKGLPDLISEVNRTLEENPPGNNGDIPKTVWERLLGEDVLSPSPKSPPTTSIRTSNVNTGMLVTNVVPT